MTIKKKMVVATAAGLKAKTENALGAFRALVEGLKATNEEAAAAKAANSEQMAMLAHENVELDAITAQNEKIVQNIENILGI